MSVEFDDPLSWTVEHAAGAGYQLTVYCMGSCRSGRMVDLVKLAGRGLGRRRLAVLAFRCNRPGCGGKGEPFVEWWEGERSTWNYAKGQLKGHLPKAVPKARTA